MVALAPAQAPVTPPVSTMNLADFRLSVSPGHGLVARFPTAILIVTASDWRSLPAVDRLLDECRRPEPMLAERLAALVTAEPAKVPAFCAVVDDAGGLAFFVHGDTQVVITGAQPAMRMSGRGTAGWTGAVGDQVASLAIGPAGATDVDLSPTYHDDRGDLRDGVVPGGAVLLIPRDRPTAAPSPPLVRGPLANAAAPAEADQPGDRPFSPAPFVPAPPEPPAPVPVAPPPAAPPPVEAERPAPIVTAPTTASTATASVPPAALDGPPVMVWGIHCKRGHFNNPDARYCRMCGTHMVHQRRDPVLGPRPILGFLVVDDGATYKLDADYAIGRNPEVDPAVVAGEARGLVLSDPEDTVSPVHAAIRLDQWDVFLEDMMPRYGTHIWRPGTAGWVRLEPGQKVMLEPRSHILVGRRTLIYDSMNRR